MRNRRNVYSQIKSSRKIESAKKRNEKDFINLVALTLLIKTGHVIVYDLRLNIFSSLKTETKEKKPCYDRSRSILIYINVVSSDI